MATFRNTEYTEKSFPGPSPNMSIAREAQRALRRIFVSGELEAQNQAHKDFLGFETYIKNAAPVAGNATGIVSCNYISRIPPDVLSFTDQPCLYAQSIAHSEGVAMPGWDDDQDMNDFSDNCLTIEYRTTNGRQFASDQECIQGNPLKPLFGLPDDSLMHRSITRIWRQAGKILTLPTGFLDYVPDAGEVWPRFKSLAIPGGSPFREPEIELTYIWHDVPLSAVPILAIMQAWNTVNQLTFDPFRWGTAFPGETVLFVHAEPKEHNLITGELGCDMYYRFLVAPHRTLTGVLSGHNTGLTVIPGTNPPTFDYRRKRRVVDIANVTVIGTQLPIPEFNFEKLFRPDQPGGF